MSNSNADIYVAFGADTGGLEAAIALAKQNVQAMTREMGALAREMQKTGAATDSELAAKLKAAGGAVAGAKSQLADLAGQLKTLTAPAAAPAAAIHDVAAAVEHTGSAASHAHTGLGFYVRELHALMDEFGSGRDRQAVGTLSNLIMTTLQSNLSLIPYAAAVAAVGGAFAYLAYQAWTANSAMKGIQTEAAINQLRLTDDESRKLVASIVELGNVSNSNAQAIADAFLPLGPAGVIVAQIASTYIPQMVTGEKKMSEVSEEAAKAFVDLNGAGRKYVETSRNATEEIRRQYEAAVTAGDKNKAYSIILGLQGGTLRKNADDHALAKARIEDHSQALLKASQSAGTMSVAEADTGEAVERATAKIDAETRRLGALNNQLLSTADSALRFSENMDAALKIDNVAQDVETFEKNIAGLNSRIASAPDKSSPDVLELTRALNEETDKLKEAQQRFASGVSDRDALAQMKQDLERFDATYRGSEAGRLAYHQQKMQELLAGDTLTQKQRDELTTESLNNQRSIQNAQNDSYLRILDQQLAAAGKNYAARVGLIEGAVRYETEHYGEGSKQQEAMLDRLARAKEEAANRGAAAAQKGAKEELAAAVAGYQGEVKAAEDAAKRKIQILDDEYKLKQITEQAKVAGVQAALTEEYNVVKTEYDREIALAGQTKAKIVELQNQQRHELASIVDQMTKDQMDAASQTEKAWESAAGKINSAFDGQIDGLLKGTTNFRTAMKNVLASLTQDMLKFFVNWGLQQAETVAKNIVLGQMQVTAHVTGDAAMASADSAASAAGGVGFLAHALQNIQAAAAQTFAGVTAFMAPAVGPAAPAVGAGAMASVLAVEGMLYDTGAWNIPSDRFAGLHKGEMVVPSRGGIANEFREFLSGGGLKGGGNVAIHPTVNFGVSALDAASVGNWMRSNSPALMKHMDEAVRHGAALGLRRLSFRT